MQAYEFESVVEKGYISIPHNMLNKMMKKVKVILLYEDEGKAESKHKEFTANLHTKGFKFDREEANER
jgi:tRNA 2-selenouridine synthase SelU